MILCSVVQQDLEDAAHDQTLALLDPGTLDHIRQCDDCNTFVAALIAQQLRHLDPSRQLELACAEVEAALPGALDRLAAGDGARYERLRPHLLGCPSCYQSLTLMRELGAIARLPRPAPEQPAIPLPVRVFEWPRRLLRELAERVSASQTLFAVRGPESLPPPAYSQALSSGYTLKLILDETTPAQLNMIVVLEPPLRATAVLVLGEREFRSALDSAGRATFAGLPAGLLTDLDGPPLALRLE